MAHVTYEYISMDGMEELWWAGQIKTGGLGQQLSASRFMSHLIYDLVTHTHPNVCIRMEPYLPYVLRHTLTGLNTETPKEISMLISVKPQKLLLASFIHSV